MKSQFVIDGALIEALKKAATNSNGTLLALDYGGAVSRHGQFVKPEWRTEFSVPYHWPENSYRYFKKVLRVGGFDRNNRRTRVEVLASDAVTRSDLRRLESAVNFRS